MTDHRSRAAVGLASDDRGAELKPQLLHDLTEEHFSISVRDRDAFALPSSLAEDRAAPVAQAISEGEIELGLLLSTTGIDMAILANQFAGVRAAVVQSPFEAELACRHFDVNVLCLGQFTSDVERIISAGLRTPFEDWNGETQSRHARRGAKIVALEARSQLGEGKKPSPEILQGSAHRSASPFSNEVSDQQRRHWLWAGENTVHGLC